MPKSLRCKIKHLCHNGTLSEKERDRILKALEQEPCDNCISREHAKQFLYYEIERLHDDGLYDCFSRIIDDMYNELPSVKPTYTDEEIDKIQEIEQAYVDKMVELAIEETKRPKGKWIEVEVRNVYATLKCSVCGRVIEPIFDFCKYSYEDIKKCYPYCHCGAEMSGGGEDET